MDITSVASVEKAFKRIRYAYGKRIASVVHLAAYFDFSGESSPLYPRTTVEGTERLLRALLDFEVEQFIFSSSLLVNSISFGANGELGFVKDFDQIRTGINFSYLYDLSRAGGTEFLDFKNNTYEIMLSLGYRFW